MPGSFRIEYGDGLRERGVAVQVRREPFFEERLLKTADEVEAISRAMQRTEAAMDAAIGAIREAEVHDGVLRWRGTTLTAERVRRLISMTLIEDGLLAQHTIVACGEAGCDPHNEGSGPLRAGQSIIIDIFPRDEASRYHADITRTVVKGRASDMLRKMYRAVAAGQERAFALLRDGSDGEAIHRAVHKRRNSDCPRNSGAAPAASKKLRRVKSTKDDMLSPHGGAGNPAGGRRRGTPQPVSWRVIASRPAGYHTVAWGSGAPAVEWDGKPAIHGHGGRRSNSGTIVVRCPSGRG